MPKALFSDVLQYLRKVCAAQEARDLSDRQLLHRFIVHHEDAAFTVLVQRHGPMVLGVCQRVLGNVHDAEDCLQATFMILVRRASCLRLKASLATWLYTVAQRVAYRSRAQASARRKRERRVEPMPQRELLDELTWQELRGVLDAEIAKLPEKYQAPLVLCYLEGKSQEKAAKELGWPKNSLARRLEHARELLRQRLVRRGVALSAGVLATALCEKVSAAPVGAVLVIKTVKAAASIAAGKAVAGTCLSVQAVTLAEEAGTGMVGIKGKFIIMMLVLGLGVGGAGLAGYGGLGETKQDVKIAKEQQPPATIEKRQKEEPEPPPLTDHYGDPLPKGAVARLGTERFRQGLATTGLAFAPDGKVLASTGRYGSGSLCVWDVATGRALRRLVAPEFVSGVAFSPDGKWLVTGGTSLKLRDATTGKELRNLERPAGVDIYGPVFSPDGQTVASCEFGGAGPAVVLWDAVTGKEIRRIEGHADMIESVAFSPDGKVLASGSEDETARLWDVATGKEIHRFEGLEKGINRVVFSASGKVLASSASDGVIRLWDVETGKLLHRLKGNQGSPVAFSPDGTILAFCKRNGTICLCDPETGKEFREWLGSAKRLAALAFSPSGKMLASSGYFDSAIRLWDPSTGKEIKPAVGHTGMVDLLLYAPDGKTLFSCGQDWKALEWDLATVLERRQLFAWPPEAAEAKWRLNTFALSLDGGLLAWTGSFMPSPAGEGKPDPVIRLWDTKLGKELFRLSGHTDDVTFLRFSPDGKLLASMDKNGMRLWDVGMGKELQHLPGVFGGAFSPDGKVLALAGDGNTSILLWDLAAAKEIRRWDSQGQDVGWLVFSPDGKLLASTDRADKSVHIWEAATGKERLRFGGESWVMALTFSPIGHSLAASVRGRRTLPGGDNVEGCTIHLWEIPSGLEILQIEMPQPWVSSLAFAPDGRSLATGGGDSTILVWDLTGQSASGKLKSAPLTVRQMEGLWSELAGDAPTANRALWAFALAPKQSLPFLSKQLKPAQPAAAEEVAKLVGDLGSERYAVRQKAAQALEAMGESAHAALHKTLKENLALEVRQRIEQILEKRDREVLRKLRAIEALEQIGTREAREVLEILARETPNPRVAEAAGAALRRLAK
jgi:RNA polymerase sigma factor (sigma-70 family)